MDRSLLQIRSHDQACSIRDPDRLAPDATKNTALIDVIDPAIRHVRHSKGSFHRPDLQP